MIAVSIRLLTSAATRAISLSVEIVACRAKFAAGVVARASRPCVPARFRAAKTRTHGRDARATTLVAAPAALRNIHVRCTSSRRWLQYFGGLELVAEIFCSVRISNFEL